MVLGIAVIKDHLVLQGLARMFIQGCLVIRLHKIKVEEISTVHILFLESLEN